ncbi:hypothetical protein BdWA1_000196 [Babesia duncani]|uniref:Uncharacterized protein n=1 Tax=Babesia duncani TaxID=323732 RepID=A0AAD9PLW1_9APIC|nr:hypothetical protein BdWA1_000196 [Babesia duncani]
MAGRAEKKQRERQRYYSCIYNGIAFTSALVWAVNLFRGYYRHILPFGLAGLISRALLMVTCYGCSLCYILYCLQYDFSFSFANDVFIITTCVAWLSLWTQRAYWLFSIILVYIVSKQLIAYYNWALTPEPEYSEPVERQPKQKIKHKVYRAP